MKNAGSLPSYEKPPVVEVVCGIQFKPLSSLIAPHLGSLWEKYRKDYPNCKEMPPIDSVVESYDEPRAVEFSITNRPVFPRIWFLNENESGLIQVQRDRFLFNWKIGLDGVDYPRYEMVIDYFRTHLDAFELFLRENDLSSMEPRQYEMTYVNHIPLKSGTASLKDIGEVFPDYNWRVDNKRFLPSPESINWRTSFNLPDQVGRLHVSVQTVRARSDQSPKLRFDLTVRGMPEDKSKDAMSSWFDLAHEWIVCGFADLTGEKIQKSTWRRSQ